MNTMRSASNYVGAVRSRGIGGQSINVSFSVEDRLAANANMPFGKDAYVTRPTCEALTVPPVVPDLQQGTRLHDIYTIPCSRGALL